MKSVRSLLLIVFALGQVAHCQNKLVVILLDGFRFDYVEHFGNGVFPNLEKFISQGVKADYVQTIFPSKSYPSWTTIVTGKV